MRPPFGSTQGLFRKLRKVGSLSCGAARVGQLTLACPFLFSRIGIVPQDIYEHMVRFASGYP
jgi:hypothetical protein